MHGMKHLVFFLYLATKDSSKETADIDLDFNLQCSIYNLIFTYELFVDLSSL